MMIFVKTTFEAIHKWADAPQEVAFLRNPHRHLFHVKLTVEVFHEDRDLEFFTVKEQLDHTIKQILLDDPMQSCEWMAIKILFKMSTKYPSRLMTCSVSEDGENGAIVSGEDL